MFWQVRGLHENQIIQEIEELPYLEFLDKFSFLHKDVLFTFTNTDFLDKICVIFSDSNLECWKPVSFVHSVAEVTFHHQTVKSRENECFGPQLDWLFSNIDLKDYLNSTSPDSYKFWNLLINEIDDNSLVDDLIESLFNKILLSV